MCIRDSGKSRGLPRYLENVYVIGEDACTETENRRNQQEDVYKRQVDVTSQPVKITYTSLPST